MIVMRWIEELAVDVALELLQYSPINNAYRHPIRRTYSNDDLKEIIDEAVVSGFMATARKLGLSVWFVEHFVMAYAKRLKKSEPVEYEDDFRNEPTEKQMIEGFRCRYRDLSDSEKEIWKNLEDDRLLSKQPPFPRRTFLTLGEYI